MKTKHFKVHKEYDDIFLKKYRKHCIKIQKMSEAEYLCQKLGAVTLQK